MIGQMIVNNELSTEKNQIPERSETLNQLYEQSKYLENNGTPFEIEQNRLAIKNEWQAIDPEIADLYKPIQTSPTAEELERFTPRPNNNQANAMPANRSWGDDFLVHEGAMSGVDVEVAENGDIYILGYYNDYFGTEEAIIYIYKSTDDGASFSLLNEISISNFYSKMQVVLLEPSEYLAVYAVTEDGLFGVYRYELETLAIDVQLIATDVSYFSVDRNFPGNTSNTRVFATYVQSDGVGCEDRVFSARSTAGQFGLNWVDATQITTICSRNLEFTYGRSGATYTAYVSISTGNTYVQANNNYNDPASWSDEETIIEGSENEVIRLSICATRKAFNEDDVLLFASNRPAGTSDPHIITIFQRENANPFETLITIFNGEDLLFADSWIRKELDAEVIRMSFVSIENDNRTLFAGTYDGTTLEDVEIVTDASNILSGGAIAETQNQNPCIAFSHIAPTIDGDNIYFNVDGVLGMDDTTISNFQYYPNPTSETLTIKTSQAIDKVELFSIAGKKVKQFIPNQAEVELNVQDLSSGMYIMTIHSNNQTANYKVIKD